MKKTLAVVLALLVGVANAQSPWELALQKTITNGGIAGAARYTTTNRPTCNTANIGGVIWNTTTATEQVCDGSAWASVAVGATGITIGNAVTGGGANRILFEDGSQNLAASASFTYVATNNVFTLGSATTAGVATTIFDSAMGGASTTDNFWNITGTMPTVLTQIGSGVNVQLTGAGSSGVNNQAVNIDYNAGYTGGFRNIGLRVSNLNLGTGTTIYGTGMNATVGLHALLSTVGNPTVGIAFKAEGNAGSQERVAIIGEATGNSGSLDVEGVVGNAINPGTAGAAGWFTLGSVGKPTGAGFALGITNGAATLPILSVYDNTTAVTIVQDGGSQWQSLGATTLTESSATAFVQVAVASNGRQGGILYYCVDASDATDFQERCGNVSISLVNKAGTETCTVGTPADVVAVSAGTLTVSFDTDTSPTNACNYRANAVSSLTQTTLRINSQVVLYGNAATAVTKQ